MAKAEHKEFLEKWPITSKRYVAFIDIMGFKDYVMRNTHAKVYQMMKTIDNAATRNANIKWSKAEAKLVQTTTYSDSILIYSKDGSKNATTLSCVLYPE